MAGWDGPKPPSVSGIPQRPVQIMEVGELEKIKGDTGSRGLTGDVGPKGDDGPAGPDNILVGSPVPAFASPTDDGLSIRFSATGWEKARFALTTDVDAVDANLADHVDDTMAVHGIADTSRIITQDNIAVYAPPPDLSGYVQNTDARLTDARFPLPHAHPIVDVTGLQPALDAKVGTGTNGSLTGLTFTGASPSVDSTSTYKDINFKSGGVMALRVLRAGSFTDNADSAFFQFGTVTPTEKGVISAGSGYPLQRFSVVATGMFVGAPTQSTAAHGAVPPPAAALHVQNYTPTQYGALIRHASSPTTDYFRVEHADTTAKMRLDQFGGFHVPSGGSEFGGASVGSTTLAVRPTATNQRALALQMLTGQANDMFAVLDPSSVKQLSIDQFGQLVMGNNAGAFSTNGSLTASTIAANGRSGATNIVTKGLVNQTTPVLVAQSSDASPVLRVNPFGAETPNGEATVRVDSGGIAFRASAPGGAGIIGQPTLQPSTSGDRLGYFLGGAPASSGSIVHSVGMSMFAAESWGGAGRGGYLTFETTPIGTAARVEQFRVDPDGLIRARTNDFQTDVAGRGIIVRSPDNLLKRRIGIDNAGALTLTAVP